MERNETEAHITVTGVCRRCASKSDEELAEIGTGYVKKMCPDARRLPEEGSA